MSDRPHTGDEVGANCSVISIHIEQLSQLFDSLDPSPFHKKDLDRDAAEYIVGSAQDLPRRAPLGLVLKVDKPAGWKDEGRVVGDAVRDHFAREAMYTRRRLRTLLRRGWVSLVIGLAFLAVVATAVTYIGRVSTGPLTAVLRESLLIGGWVAMWRPLETFLYDWWPIRGELRLHERLSRMAVRIEYMGVGNG